jgi:hypothetical protein
MNIAHCFTRPYFAYRPMQIWRRVAFELNKEHRGDIERPDRPAHMDRQAFPGRFIQERQDPTSASLLGLIFHKIPTPYDSVRCNADLGVWLHRAEVWLSFGSVVAVNWRGARNA